VRRLFELAAPLALLGLALLSWFGWRAVPEHPGPAWPSVAHPLGIDVLGRDFVGVLAHGAADFVGPGALAVLVLLGAVAARASFATARPVLDAVPSARGPGWFLLSAPPRLLLVMLAMLLFDEPSPFAAAAVVTALYLPVALDEIGTRLRGLQEQQVLAGLVAHGLSAPRIVGRHLLRGHLAGPVRRHGAMLFLQVAFTQIALAWVFGASAVTPGLGVSWGMELKRYAAWLPSAGGPGCTPDAVCVPWIAALHTTLLLAVCLLLLGGSFRRAER
jgi:peptide/nickel transport system permease protein